MVSCSVYGCSNASKANLKKPGVTFHKFPLNPERKALWIQAIHRMNWSPSSHARICSIHFKEEDMDRTSLSCVRVRENAVPSLVLGFPSRKALGADPHRREASPPNPWKKTSLENEMVPSTSRDSMDEVIPMELVETNIQETTPKYRNLLAQKEKVIKDMEKILAKYRRRLADKDRCIARIRQRS